MQHDTTKQNKRRITAAIYHHCPNVQTQQETRKLERENKI